MRSFTEAKLVGINDAMLIEAQGYSVEHNVPHQDNVSTILLATNGRWLSFKRTKHIKACHFLLKDKVESKEVEISYEPTKTMSADMFTNPKQGKQVQVLCASLMNCDKNYNDEVEKIKTHPDCLPKAKYDIEDTDNNMLQQIGATSLDAEPKSTIHCRSVLGKTCD